MATLVLLRHGESEWNKKNLFTGWVDVDLTEKGEEQARLGGLELKKADLLPTVLHTSLMTRAIRTSNLALEACDRSWIPVKRHWRLNERHYGALQGLNKAETAARHGEAQVKIWRRSYDIPPPPMPADDSRHAGRDPRYADLSPADIPLTESLADTVTRFLPYWHDTIAPSIRSGRKVLIAAHGNSLRALVKYLDEVSNEAIVELNIPTGIPLVYELDERLRPRHRFYLGDPKAAEEAAARVAQQSSARK